MGKNIALEALFLTVLYANFSVRIELFLQEHYLLETLFQTKPCVLYMLGVIVYFSPKVPENEYNSSVYFDVIRIMYDIFRKRSHTKFSRTSGKFVIFLK